MKLIKTIFAILASLLTLMGTNGFILEKYFCTGCHQERQEVQFFEFGEINHNHVHCEDCHDSHHTCNCHLDDHLNNSEISYISFDVLFSNSEKPEVNKTTQFTQLNKLFKNLILNADIDFNGFVKNKYLIKIPPLLFKNISSTNFCASTSYFRL